MNRKSAGPDLVKQAQQTQKFEADRAAFAAGGGRGRGRGRGGAEGGGGAGRGAFPAPATKIAYMAAPAQSHAPRYGERLSNTALNMTKSIPRSPTGESMKAEPAFDGTCVVRVVCRRDGSVAQYHRAMDL